MKLSQTLQKNAKSLSNISEMPQMDAEILLSFVLNKDKTFLYTYPEYKLTVEELKLYSNYIKKRLKGYSVASITGIKDFYSLEFIVNKNTLVPRPETELMVDEVISIIKKDNNLKNITLIDLGTGTGCIPISILKNSNKQDIKCFAIDISHEALEIAQKNAKKHALTKNISFLRGSLLEPLLKADLIKNNTNSIIITANLPYLTKEQIEDSPSIQKEPALALDGGLYGMDYYIELLEQIKILENNFKEKQITILAEIDHTQVEVFKKEATKLLPYAKLEVKKDLGNYERLIILKIVNL